MNRNFDINWKENNEKILAYICWFKALILAVILLKSIIKGILK